MIIESAGNLYSTFKPAVFDRYVNHQDIITRLGNVYNIYTIYLCYFYN